MASVGASGIEHFVAPSKDCGVPDVSAVLLKADDRSLLARGAGSNGAPALTSAPEKGSRILRTSPAFWDLLRVPLASSDSTLPITILRI